MNPLELALRNLLRNRRRSLGTLLAMILGVVTVLLFGGFSRDISLEMETGYVQRGGHLQIQHRDFFVFGGGDPAAYGVADPERIIAAINKDAFLREHVVVATPVLVLGGVAGNFSAGVSRTFSGEGVVVADQNRMRQWNEHGVSLQSEPLTLTGTPDDAAVIGRGLARVLQLCDALDVEGCRTPQKREDNGKALPDDVAGLAASESAPPGSDDKSSGNEAGARIELLAASFKGAPNVADIRVIKAENQGAKEIDDVFVGMHLPRAQQLVYGKGRQMVTSIIVQLRRTADIATVQPRLKALLESAFPEAPLTVLDYKTINPSIDQIMGLFSAIFGFMAVLIAAIVLFTISTTMSTSVMERTVEIGTLRALGLRRRGIMQLFVAEGALLGFAGGIIGTLLALILAFVVNQADLHWYPPGAVDSNPLRVRVWGETGLMIFTYLGLLLVAVISSWIPARRAARFNIVDALRHV